MDMFDLPTEKELLGKVKAHLETDKPLKAGKTLDVNEVFPFWNSTACAEGDINTFKPSKGIEVRTGKVGCIKPIKSSNISRLKGHSNLSNTAQKEPEVKMESVSYPKFKKITVNTDTTYTVKNSPVGSIKPIKAGENVSIISFDKILKQMKANQMPNKVGCVKPVKAPKLNVGASDFGVVTSEKPMKNPNPKAYAKYVTKDMDNKKTEKLVELGVPEYKEAPKKASKDNLVGIVKVKK